VGAGNDYRKKNHQMRKIVSAASLLVLALALAFVGTAWPGRSAP
jgi:hypothetical protein